MKKLEENKLTGLLEGILFISGNPVKINDIINLLNVDEMTLYHAIDSYNRNSLDNNRGLIINRINNSVQMSTNPLYHKYIEQFCSIEQKINLSQAALEVLSIISYNQPVTKQVIDDIRGVRSDKPLSNLVELGLVEEVDRLNSIGHPILYGTTEEFLRCFHLQSLKDLPHIE